MFDAVSHKYLLAEYINQGKYRSYAEIGVKRADTLAHLLKNCSSLKQVYGIDIWKNDKHLRLAHQQCRDAGRLDCDWALIREDSVKGIERIRDKSLDLGFIDADHSEEGVRRDIIALYPKIRVGGILCGHDIEMPGVKAAVKVICPNYNADKHQVWWTKIPTPIVCGIPYARDRNYGRACNEFMEGVPDGGWGVVLDHDAMFAHPNWMRLIECAIKMRPDGCFVPLTNRIKCPYQQVPGVENNHDIAHHRQIGASLHGESFKLVDVTYAREPAGLCMIVSKATWREVGGFPQSLHYVDRMFWLSVKAVGKRIYLIKNLYVYHWHRGADEPIQEGEWATEHRLPNGKKIYLQKKREELPVYDGVRR